MQQPHSSAQLTPGPSVTERPKDALCEGRRDMVSSVAYKRPHTGTRTPERYFRPQGIAAGTAAVGPPSLPAPMLRPAQSVRPRTGTKYVYTGSIADHGGTTLGAFAR